MRVLSDCSDKVLLADVCPSQKIKFGKVPSLYDSNKFTAPQ